MGEAQDNGIPRFNFPKQTVRQGRETANLMARIMKGMAAGQRALEIQKEAEEIAEATGKQVSELTVEELPNFRISDLDLPGPEESDLIYDDWVKLLARHVEYVPDEWLMDDVPDEIDWSQPDSFYDYLDNDRWGDMQKAFQESRQPENEELAGNSKRRSSTTTSTPN